MFQHQFLRIRDVLERRAISRSSHLRDVATGLCTPPIRLTARCVGWPAHEIEALVRAQIKGASIDERRQLVARLLEARKQLDLSEAA